MAAERLQAVVDSSPDALIAGEDGKITVWNRAAQHLLGYSEAEAIGASGRLVVPPEHVADHERIAGTVRSGGVIRAETVVRHRDGRNVPVEVSGSGLTTGGSEQGAALFLRDITARLEAERELRLLAAVAESSADAIATSDLDGRIAYWNPAAERLFGYRAEEAIGQPVAFLSPPDTSSVEAIIGELRAGRGVDEQETVRMAKDRRRVEVSIRGFPIRDAGGALIGFGVIMRDISDRHRLEQQVRESQKMEAIGRLAGGIAHDFNNLLTVDHRLRRPAARASSPTGRSRATLAEIAQRRPSARPALTRQLLAFSRQQVMRARGSSTSTPSSREHRAACSSRLIGDDIELARRRSTGRCRRSCADPGQIEQVDHEPRRQRARRDAARRAADDRDRAGELDATTRRALERASPAAT